MRTDRVRGGSRGIAMTTSGRATAVPRSSGRHVGDASKLIMDGRSGYGDRGLSP